MKANKAIAKILKKEGVEFFFFFPGNPYPEPLAEEDIRSIHFRNEHIAIQVADGYSRSTMGKKIGICGTQAGPGVQVAYPGIHSAFVDNSPILLLPTAEDTHRISTEPYYDIRVELRGITKWAETINYVSRIPEIMRRAFSRLRNGRLGPVVVDLPKDLIDQEVSDEMIEAYEPPKRYRSLAEPANVKAAVALLLSAKSPLIRAGAGALWSESWDELIELAEYLHIPVTSTLNGKSAFPEDHPLYLGAGTLGFYPSVSSFYAKADVVFAVGSSCTEDRYIYSIPKGKKVIQLINNDRDLNKDYSVAAALMGDAKLVLQQVIAEVKTQTGARKNPALVKEIKSMRDDFVKKYTPDFTSKDKPINPARVYWELMKVIDRKRAIVVSDAGGPRNWMTTFWEATTPGGFIGYGKDHCLGAGMGLAMGAKLANPDKICVHMGGDLAFGEAGIDWEVAVRNKIAIINIVLNNGQTSTGRKDMPLASEKYRCHEFFGNYKMIAEGCGSYAERIEDPEQIIPAFKRAIELTDSGTPVLLEFMSGIAPVIPV